MKKLMVSMIGILWCSQVFAQEQNVQIKTLVLHHKYETLPNGKPRVDESWSLDLETFRYIQSHKPLFLKGGISVGSANGFWLADVSVKKHNYKKDGSETTRLLSANNYAVYCDEGMWQYLGGIEYTGDKSINVPADTYVSIPKNGTVGKFIFDNICGGRALLKYVAR